jgi:hypothetical protein
MNVYQSSVLEDDVEIAAQDNGGEKSSDHDGVTPPFQKILDLAVDPIMESAMMEREEKKLRPRWDAWVYVVSCLTYVQVGIHSFCEFCLVMNPFRRLRRSRKVFRGYWSNESGRSLMST